VRGITAVVAEGPAMQLPGCGAPLRHPLVLAVDLSRPVIDAPATSPLARLRTARRPDLRGLLRTLADAAEDDRVRAVLVRADAPAETWAHAEELREAFAAVRRAGTPVLAHAQTFGEAGDATLAYYTAVAADEVLLQPTGEVPVTGVATEVPFLAELLDKLDVEPQLDRRHEYKTAPNRLTERELTDADRETVDRIVASHHEQLVAAIAAGRGLDAERVSALLDAAPHRARAALEAGLVDRLAYRDEATAAAKERAGEGARLIAARSYRPPQRQRRTRRATRVALVHASGMIQVGPSRRGLAGPVMGADTVVAGLGQARRSKQVRAVLLRVDSPGGSAVASDAIRRAVARAGEAGTPVIASMGSVAGSGGYWVSMDADRIVAAPGTLTGSIGVVSGKVVTRGLRERLGVTVDEAHRGADALMFSSNERFTDAQWDKIGDQLDAIYEEFVDGVARGRGLDRDHVEAVARGRVWTGADACERGLVDREGGYLTAEAVLREQLGLSADAPLRFRPLPRQGLAERLGLRQPEPEEAAALTRLARGLARALGLGTGTARMPAWSERAR